MNVADLPERMRQKVIVAHTGCWEWTAAINSRGYGQWSVQGVSRSTHRVAYELLVGPIPEGLQIDHLCRNKRCCNPEHLEPVSALVNIHRRPDVHKSHCARGHELTPENTILKNFRGSIRRNCRTCVNDQARARRRAS
jgi:hypothetical protein